MIEALLHGKLSAKLENMEDVLTSNVFGLLQYLPPEAGIIPFLSCATTVEGDTLLAALKEVPPADISVLYRFWPTWPHCEPDVVLDISINGTLRYMVVVEAKFRSGKSSEADDVAERPKDQLAREWVDLADEAQRFGADPILLYLTADIFCPTTQIQDSFKEFHRKELSHEPVICWMSWRELPRLFRHEPHGTPLKAIARMAEDKLNLTYFHGVENLVPVGIDWKFYGKAPQWRFEFKRSTLDWQFD